MAEPIGWRIVRRHVGAVIPATAARRGCRGPREDRRDAQAAVAVITAPAGGRTGRCCIDETLASRLPSLPQQPLPRAGKSRMIGRCARIPCR